MLVLLSNFLAFTQLIEITCYISLLRERVGEDAVALSRYYCEGGIRTKVVESGEGICDCFRGLGKW